MSTLCMEAPVLICKMAYVEQIAPSAGIASQQMRKTDGSLTGQGAAARITLNTSTEISVLQRMTNLSVGETASSVITL